MRSELDGQDLLDPALLEQLVRATGTYWGSDHLGDLTAAFWYGLSQVLLDPVAAGAVRVGGPVATADPRRLHLHRRGHFFTEADRLPGPADDRAGLDLLIGALAEVSGSSPSVFRAIGGDSLGSRLIFNAPHGSPSGLAAAGQVLADRTGFPAPVLADGSRGVVLLRRSCCRLFRLPRGGLCTACPRRSAQERAAVLGLPTATLG